jgi:hypothetical protein
MIPILGFLPDADPAIPGVLVDCANLIPTERGMMGGPTAATAVTGLAALAAECRGAAVLVDTGGVRRNFAGTQTKMYELVASAWTDRSRGGNYTGSSDNRWSFAQFGNVALASNLTEVIQASASGAFADIATAPKAKIIVSAKDVVIALGTNDGTFGDLPDGWWCSAFQDYSSWTPSVTTSAARGRLVGVPGGLTAGAMLGAYVVAYKERGAYLGQIQIGTPGTIQWDQVPGEFGCVGQDAVVDVGGAHFIVGPDNFWLFDGTRPIPIGVNEVRQWFYNDSSPTYRYRTIVYFDRQNSRVWVHYPSSSTSSGRPDRALVYNLVSKKWGRANRSIEAVFQFVAPGLTWDTFSTVGASWDVLPNIAWDSQAWQAAGRALGYFDTSHTLYTLTGTSDASSFTTGDIGDDLNSSGCDRVKVHYITDPTSATATGFTKETSGGALTTRDSQPYSDGKFDLRQSGRWHRYSVAHVGDVEVRAFDPRLVAESMR